MYAALCSLEDSSALAHAICKGEEPSKGIIRNSFCLLCKLSLTCIVVIVNKVNEVFFCIRPLEHYGELPSSLFLMQYGFQRLNRYQEAAVKEALSNPFTLIQGPPGKHFRCL